MMKSIILGILFFILLIPVDVRDIPRFSVEQIVSAVQVYSPDCKLSSCG
jgi:hypothetical protein